MSSTRLTSRVARGSIWSLSGQSATLLASLISTPFVIRLLGAEGYGVLALVNLTFAYMAFADVGMSVASTRFASNCQGGESEEEVAIVWTSLLIVSIPSLLAAAALFSLAPTLVIDWLRLPAHLCGDAVIAFRLAAGAFLAKTFAGVINTPQLARLRLGAFTLINSGTNVAQVLTVLLVLLLGGGLVSAVAVIAAASILSLVLNTLVSVHLLPDLTRPRFSWSLVRPLLKFGGAVIFIAFAGAVLFHLEKPLLTRLSSLQAFAFYAVAFLIARTPAIVPGAVHQSLLPALSRLQADEDRGALQGLYERGIRGLTLWSLPLVALVWIFAAPLLHLAAGEGAVEGALLPLRILLLGTLVDSISFPARCLLEASAKPHRVAIWQLRLLVPYVLLAYLAISRFGAVGAAAAWTARASTETLCVFWEAWRACGLNAWSKACRAGLVTALALFAGVLFAAATFDLALLATVALTCAAACIYLPVAWRKLLLREERQWLFRWGVARFDRLRKSRLAVNG